MSTPFWQDSGYTTVFFILWLGLADEFVFRRNPQFGFYLGVFMLAVIPVLALAFWQEYDRWEFTLIKAISVGIPALIVTLYRLAHVSLNCGESARSADTGDTAGSGSDTEETINVRRLAKERIYRYLPSIMTDKILPSKYFASEQWNHYFHIFIYLFLCVNIMEAVVYEAWDGESSDGLYDWSKYCNVGCGLCLIATIPMPMRAVNKHLFFIDTATSKYSDFILDFGGSSGPSGTDGGCRLSSTIWFVGYTLWNLEFVLRFFGYELLFGGLTHLSIPLIRGVVYRRPLGGMYFQSRVYTLAFYCVAIITIRDFALESEDNTAKVVASGLVLMIWSVFNLLVMLCYVVWWFFVKEKELQSTNLEMNASSNMKTTDVRCQV